MDFTDLTHTSELPEALPVSQEFKKFSTFHGT
jgi:hypothetical protein